MPKQHEILDPSIVRPFTGQTLAVSIQYVALREVLYRRLEQVVSADLASLILTDLDNYVRDITGVKAK